MGQSVSRIRDFTVKCGELLPVFRYKRLASEQSRTIQELEKVILSQKTEIDIMSNEWRRISELEEKVKSQSLELGVREKLSEISQSMVDVNKNIEKLENYFTSPKSSSQIGEDGEYFVYECLRAAYPNNTGIVKSSEKNCGDIFFRIENSDKILMIEVKNNVKGSVAGLNNGRDIQKFFSDLHGFSVHFSGGILVSLNGPVDLNVAGGEPLIDRGKPYVYVDHLKHYPDPVCLLQVIVNMMVFMTKYTDNMRDDNIIHRLDTYKKQSDKLLKIYKDMLRQHGNQKKSLDLFRDEITDLKLLLSGMYRPQTFYIPFLLSYFIYILHLHHTFTYTRAKFYEEGK